MPKAPKINKSKNLPYSRRVPGDVDHLGSYFSILNSVIRKEKEFWFRGHANSDWGLTPSALRYQTKAQRTKALRLLSDFMRLAEIRIGSPPSPSEKLKWVQLAQHYGLPTRLLDWTKNAAIALYFACCERPDNDGAVLMLNPVDLNREVYPKRARILDPNQDARTIHKYLQLDGSKDNNGLRTVAINPIWNSERIMLQQGVFTIHGSKDFTLRDEKVASLVQVIIRGKHKTNMLNELETVGINEMAIFPEAEHVCKYLKWREQLR